MSNFLWRVRKLDWNWSFRCVRSPFTILLYLVYTLCPFASQITIIMNTSEYVAWTVPRIVLFFHTWNTWNSGDSHYFYFFFQLKQRYIDCSHLLLDAGCQLDKAWASMFRFRPSWNGLLEFAVATMDVGIHEEFSLSTLFWPLLAESKESFQTKISSIRGNFRSRRV